MTVFIRRAPVEENTASECIRVIPATYGCKILQLYEYDANVYGYGWELRMTLQEYQFMQHKRQLIIGLRYFGISLNSAFFKIKKNNKKYYVFMKIKLLIGRRIRIGRRLHVKQPLQLRECEWEMSVARWVPLLEVFLSIPSGEILDKNYESLNWWQTFANLLTFT